MASNVVLSNEEFNVVGTRPIRHDGNDKVTGRARYSADITLPRLLHGKILRSPHAHAKIKSIDASKALALDGVMAVVTSADFAQPGGKVTDLGEGAMANPKWISNNCMAAEKALYKGHAVAAVAATSLQLAEQALALIDVDYEVLPAVVDLESAMQLLLIHLGLAMAPSPRSATLPPGWAKSAEVTTAFTPGRARALLTSMDFIRAWAWGLRRIFPWSSRGRVISAL